MDGHDPITVSMEYDPEDFDEWYTRAVEVSGFTHDLYRWRLAAFLLPDPSTEFSAYVIRQNGQRLEPEEIISRLQRLAEIEESAGT